MPNLDGMSLSNLGEFVIGNPGNVADPMASDL
jgi:hypothetical protein